MYTFVYVYTCPSSVPVVRTSSSLSWREAASLLVGKEIFNSQLTTVDYINVLCDGNSENVSREAVSLLLQIKILNKSAHDSIDYMKWLKI